MSTSPTCRTDGRAGASSEPQDDAARHGQGGSIDATPSSNRPSRPQIVISAGDWVSIRPSLAVSRADLFTMIDQFDDVYSNAMSARGDEEGELVPAPERSYGVSGTSADGN